MRRTAKALGATAAVAGGIALGFVAERRLLHPRLEVAAPQEGEPELGTLAGEERIIEGPDGLPIAVETYGPPRGTHGGPRPQVVLVHGWICTGRVWHEQVRGLAEDTRLITFDLPGHGRTPSPGSGDYDLDLLADSLLAVIEEVAEPGPVVLVGHSLGGMTVMHAMDRHRERLDDRVTDVVVMSTTSRARPERFTFEFGIHAVSQLERGVRRVVPRLRESRISGATGRLYGSSSDLSTLLVRSMAVGPAADPRVADFTEQLRIASDPDMVLGLASAVLGVDVDAGLARSHARISIVVGTHDRLTPRSLSERMAAISGGELVELPGVGHMAPLEGGDDVNRLLRGHLAHAAETWQAQGGGDVEEAGAAEDPAEGVGAAEGAGAVEGAVAADGAASATRDDGGRRGRKAS